MASRSLASLRANLRFSSSVRNTLDDDITVSVTHPNLNYNPSLSNGLGNNQANRGWQSTDRTLASGATETLDLYDMASIDIGAGAGLDGLGQSFSPCDNILGIVIVNENAITADGQLEISPDPSNGWTPIGTHTVATGGALRGQSMLAKFCPADDGFEVTDASNNMIRMTANGAAVTYSMYLIYRHDDEVSSSSISSSESSSSWSSLSSASSASSVSSSSQSSSSSGGSSASSASSASSSSSSSQSSSSSSSQSSSVSSLTTSSASSASSASSSSSVSSSSPSSGSSVSSSMSSSSSESSSSWSS